MQFVIVDDDVSEWIKVPRLPQGFILVTLFFEICKCASYLINIVRNEPCLFADDAKLFARVMNCNDRPRVGLQLPVITHFKL